MIEANHFQNCLIAPSARTMHQQQDGKTSYTYLQFSHKTSSLLSSSKCYLDIYLITK